MTDYKDLAHRTFWTFIEAFLAVLIGSGVLELGVDVMQAAAIAGIGGALTVVLVFARQQLGRHPHDDYVHD
jgi:uncharacterized membrane protein